MSAHGCVGQCPQCKQGCLICHPCLPTCSRVNTWSPKTSLNNQTLEELTQKALEDAGCVGPYESPHRCSNLHCEHCGVCDMIFDFAKDVQSLITRECEKLTELFREAVANSDRPYTDEHDRKVANDYKEQILSALTKFKEGK